MKKEQKQVMTIVALALMVVVSMTSCGENAKQDETGLDETKRSVATNVADSAKVETSNESEKVDQPFIWPVEGFDKSLIENGFGNYKDPVFEMEQFHQGVDIKANLGDKVLASADGKVVMAQWYGGYGQCVVIEHKDGVKTLYGHLDEMLVKNDADVKKGDTIGLAGSTGNSIKPHVHFEVKTMDKNGEYHAVDPEEFLKDLISINGNSISLPDNGNKIVDYKFNWPIEDQKKLKIETEFGYKVDPIEGFFNFHTGVDIKANLGDKVLASADGKVVKAQWYGGYGQCVVIEHKNGIQTLYGHLSKILVKKGSEVKKRDTIGLAGSTGVSTGPQIHFEVKVKDKNDKDGEYHAVDPKEFLKDLISINENSKSFPESGYIRTDVKFIWPIVYQKNIEISPRYGNMIHPIYGWKEFHSGVDIPTNLGDKVLASSNGKVVKAEFNGDYGLCIVIEHDGNIETLYAHLDKILIKTGDMVAKGDLIGLAGSTGVSTGPHIHFEVKTMDKNGEYKTVDPEEFIREQIKR